MEESGDLLQDVLRLEDTIAQFIAASHRLESETLSQLSSSLMIILFFGYYFSHHCISLLLSFTFSSNLTFRNFFIFM